MVELTPELIKDLSKTRNGFYSWDYVAALAAWIIGVGAENERLQARVQELEQDLSDQSQKRLENAQVSTDRIIALEGKIRELEQERDYLDARLAQFEKLARKFVKCKYPDSIIRLRFQALLNGEDSCSG